MSGRHDRAHGHYEQPGRRAGSTRRQHRSRGTYSSKQSRPVPEMGRNDSNTQKGRPAPQAPKPVKGGSKQGTPGANPNKGGGK